jgi:LMBR1 domain-containing protein 1
MWSSMSLAQGNRAGVVGCGFWNNSCGGLQLGPVWLAVYILIAALVVVGLPFAIFYYETDDEGLSALQSGAKRTAAGCGRMCGCARTFCVALTYTIITAAIATTILVVSWVWLSFTEIPYNSTVVPVNSVAFFSAQTPITRFSAPVSGTCSSPGATCTCGTGLCQWDAETLTFQVTFVVYLAALLSFVGWFLFVIYGGIGLVALPVDLWRAFWTRPRPSKRAAHQAKRAALNAEATKIVEAGMQFGQRLLKQMAESPGFMERRRQRADAAAFVSKYRIMVEQLEGDHYKFQMSSPDHYKKYYNPLWPWFSAFLSILCVLVTLAWVIHVFVFMAVKPPLLAFLNDYFAFFDSFASFIGTVSLALFCLYLLFAVIKGAFKFGMRFALCAVHPMQRRATHHNSFFFNIALVLMCVLPVVQFCTQAFSSYARLTDAGLLFGTQIQNLRFFRYLWQTNAFIYALLSIAGLSVIYFSCAKSDAQYARAMADQVARDVAKMHDATASGLAARGGALSGGRGLSLSGRTAEAAASSAARREVRDWGDS